MFLEQVYKNESKFMDELDTLHEFHGKFARMHHRAVSRMLLVEPVNEPSISLFTEEGRKNFKALMQRRMSRVNCAD